MPLTDRRRRAALEGTFLVDAEPGRDPRLRARAKADSPSGDGAKPRGRSKRSGPRVSSAVQRSCEQRRDPFNALHEQRWIVARAFVSEKGVRGVNLVPFIANADLFEPGANRLAPGESRALKNASTGVAMVLLAMPYPPRAGQAPRL